MNYNVLLLQKEWFEKCTDILKRDQYRCQKCGCLGYHNDSYYECETAEEIDSFLKGFRIMGETPSAFLENCDNLKINDMNVYEHEKDEFANRRSIKDITLTDLLISSFSRDYLIPIVSRTNITETKCKVYHLWKDDILHDIDWKYVCGCYFMFKESYFDKYSVRIEKRWPNNVIICLCYHCNGVCLQYAYKSALFDSTNKYLGLSIIPKGLNVHHKYYIEGKKPWEYDNDALITLCQDCHKLEHQTQQTPVYRNLHVKNIIGYAQICDRCGGSGYLPQYSHVEGGICFKCWGEGVWIM